jgi:hypothetical protein
MDDVTGLLAAARDLLLAEDEASVSTAMTLDYVRLALHFAKRRDAEKMGAPPQTRNIPLWVEHVSSKPS